MPGKAGEPHDDAKNVADAEAVDRGNEVRGTGSRSYDQVCHRRKMDRIIHTIYINMNRYAYIYLHMHIYMNNIDIQLVHAGDS